MKQLKIIAIIWVFFVILNVFLNTEAPPDALITVNSLCLPIMLIASWVVYKHCGDEES